MVSKNWSDLECEVIAADYLEMLLKELGNERYNKSDHRRNVLGKLDNRTPGSVERKHQNISSILIGLDHPYIKGYKPLGNYQAKLKEIVIQRLRRMGALVENLVDAVISKELNLIGTLDWEAVLTPPPELRHFKKDLNKGTFEASGNYSVSTKEAQNKALGRKGEEFVLALETQRLRNANRPDLAAEVEWTSEVKGDGAGFDIRSFDPRKDSELFIEVKTTRFGKYTQFYISPNEIEFSKKREDQYSLYRVFDFTDTPQMFLLDGDITQRVHLTPVNYRANF